MAHIRELVVIRRVSNGELSELVRKLSISGQGVGYLPAGIDE